MAATAYAAWSGTTYRTEEEEAAQAGGHGFSGGRRRRWRRLITGFQMIFHHESIRPQQSSSQSYALHLDRCADCRRHKTNAHWCISRRHMTVASLGLQFPSRNNFLQKFDNLLARIGADSTGQQELSPQYSPVLWGQE